VEFDETQEMLRESVRRFLAERASITGYVRPRLDGDGRTDDVWRGLAELGVCGLLAPESAGGGGLGMVETGIVCEEIGRALYPGPFASSALGAVAAILASGAEERERALLGELASGRRVGAVALHETRSRYDWRAVETRARARNGGGWRLTGVKSPVPDAAVADALVVSADADGVLGLFVVEKENAGIEPLGGLDPTRRLARVTLEDAPARRLGEGKGERDASRAIAATLDRIVVGLVADGLGAAARAFELAAAYAHERRQFGKPIGSFQAVQHVLVDMLQDLELARAATYHALWAADAADDAERHHAAAVAKAFASEAFPRIGANAIQVFAGIGYTWEHDVHLYYKRLLTVQHLCGDEAAHLDELARLVVDRAPPA